MILTIERHTNIATSLFFVFRLFEILLYRIIHYKLFTNIFQMFAGTIMSSGSERHLEFVEKNKTFDVSFELEFSNFFLFLLVFENIFIISVIGMASITYLC